MTENQNDIDIDEIRKGFEMFDVDNTGYISPLELLETFDAMNLKSKNPFIYNIISSLSKSKKHSEQITIDELISFIDSKLNTNTKKGINSIFNSLCEPNNNSLSLPSLPQIARSSGDIITEKELRSLIQKAEMGGEEIEFDEFLDILGGKNLEDNDSDEKSLSSDKENRDINIQKKNGGNTNNNSDKNNLLESKYSKNSIKSNNSNSNNNLENEVYRKKTSEKSIQNKQDINKNINDKIIKNETNFNNNKIDDGEEEDDVININISEEIKKSENQNNNKNKYRDKYNGNKFETKKKEDKEEDDEDNSDDENEETENGMESVNKSINKYLEMKIENESLKNKRIIKQDTPESKKSETTKIENNKNQSYKNKFKKEGLEAIKSKIESKNNNVEKEKEEEVKRNEIKSKYQIKKK